MKVLVIGATGGSGRAAVAALLDRGHDVTALVRNPGIAESFTDRVTIVAGDAVRSADIEHALHGQDAVVVTLGIHENPLRVRLLGPARTPLDVRSRGTRTVVDAMRRHGARRLIVQTSYGTGPTRDRLPTRYRLMFRALLGPQIADTERQDALVRSSDLDWTIVQPVNLTDSDDDEATVSDGDVSSWAVPRRAVGRVLADLVERPEYARATVAVS
ncbi:NAD(P)-binding oxidoreductase [Rhodococcus sp. NPDC047139]|uniref:NAD(P)-dependent oxidoreductase n=1 Tax=Rhodococcus sp. NPDC047139 TaxID=3155141 RepID=UPI0033EDF3F5